MDINTQAQNLIVDISYSKHKFHANIENILSYEDTVIEYGIATFDLKIFLLKNRYMLCKTAKQKQNHIYSIETSSAIAFTFDCLKMIIINALSGFFFFSFLAK